MMLQGCRTADRAEVVERDRFATPNSLKSHGERNLLSQYLCHNAKVVHAFEANTPSEKLPGTQINVPRLNLHSARGTAGARFPRFRALALFGRRPPQRVDSPRHAGIRKPAQHRTLATNNARRNTGSSPQPGMP